MEDDDDDDLIPLARERTSRPLIEVVQGKLTELQEYQAAAVARGELTVLLNGLSAPVQVRYHAVPVVKPRRVAQWKRETTRRFR